MTPSETRARMEAQWALPGCVSPLASCGWTVANGCLEPDNESVTVEGVPLAGRPVASFKARWVSALRE